MLALTALLSLATYVFADETFTLTAQGANINSKVGVANSKLVLNNQAATFILQTPSGYLTANGHNVVLTPEGIETSDSNQSKDFGIEDGKLRNGPSIDKFDFYSCPDGSIANFQCLGGVAITLYTGGATETATTAAAPVTSSSSAAAAPATSSSAATAPATSSVKQSTSSAQQVSSTTTKASSTSAPSSKVTSAAAVNSAYANSTVTDLHSTLLTITSCKSNACSSKPTAGVSTYQGAAAQAKYAAGAIAVAGALLL